VTAPPAPNVAAVPSVAANVAGEATIRQHRRRRHGSLKLSVLYVLALVREFRWTLAALVIAIVLGGALYGVAPTGDGRRLGVLNALYAAWMAMLAQPIESPPSTWYLTVLCGIYPLVGAVVIGEGVVRLALLMASRRRGEKEWVRVMVSTYRDHVVVCGLGHLGVRVVEQLVAAGVDVVALERRKAGRFVSRAAELHVPVVFGDMKQDQTLIDAGIEHARAIVIATNDPIANLEVALDARRMNAGVRVVMRMFDEAIAHKISDAMDVDVAFSSSTLAAPVVAALALQSTAAGGAGAKILSSMMIGNACYVATEITLAPQSKLVGRRVDDVERAHGARLLARTANGQVDPAAPAPDTVLAAGDTLVLHAPAQRVAELTA
jgi:Trk K+ transport system NAD-binding subunit